MFSDSSKVIPSFHILKNDHQMFWKSTESILKQDLLAPISLNKDFAHWLFIICMYLPFIKNKRAICLLIVVPKKFFLHNLLWQKSEIQQDIFFIFLNEIRKEWNIPVSNQKWRQWKWNKIQTQWGICHHYNWSIRTLCKSLHTWFLWTWW